MRVALALSALVAISGCEMAQQAADDVTRGQAKRAVNGVVAERFPGVNAAPVTDCIIEEATAQEILQIAASYTTGATGEVTQMVLQIAQRPAAATCMALNGAALLKT